MGNAKDCELYTIRDDNGEHYDCEVFTTDKEWCFNLRKTYNACMGEFVEGFYDQKDDKKDGKDEKETDEKDEQRDEENQKDENEGGSDQTDEKDGEKEEQKDYS